MISVSDKGPSLVSQKDCPNPGMEDDILEVDSPMEPAVDIDDEEEEEPPHLSLDGTSGPRDPAPKKARTENRAAQLEYPESLPYPAESIEQMDARLDHIIRRLVDCVHTKDYDVGFVQWNHKLQCWLALKYPMLRATRARLARLYYELAVLPGMDVRLVEVAANMCMTLVESKKRIDIRDLVLPWRPLYALLEKELFPKQRRTGLTNISETLLDLAEFAQRFFAPQETDEMLQTFLPRLDGSNLNSVIATQAFLVHFLPISHPKRWLPAMFRLWESFTSSLFDDQMLDLLARLAEMHVADPSVSTEAAAKNVGKYVDSFSHAGEKDTAEGSAGRSDAQEDTAMQVDEQAGEGAQEERKGLWNEVGIFTDAQMRMVMSKALRAAGLPVGSSKGANAALMAQGSSYRTGADASASGTSLKMKKPSDKLHSFAVIIVYSMAKDAQSLGTSLTPSTSATPAAATPNPGASPKLGPLPHPQQQTFVGGSKALDHLARFIQATESYFHPSNWGLWQIQLSNFVQHLTWEFLKRWKEEEKPDCKTPQSWRLTPEIRREFVLTLRTVCLLSMFSKDSLTIASSQASLKRMSILEPELVLPAVLERSFSSLEALETTHRTTAIITALSTLSLPLVSREIYRGGAKNLVPLLQLCIPGIDLNDPMKTISTSMFVLLALMTVKVDDLTRPETQDDSEGKQGAPEVHIEAPYGEDGPDGERRQLSAEEEDALVRASTAGFEDWVVSFFRRVLALFENLPEEGKGGRQAKTEEQVINTLLAACDSVCGSLSPHLFDLTFKIVADFCASTVSSNSVRVIGSLVSCFARADSAKVLNKLLPICAANIRTELEHGASSIRTTSTSTPLQSDSTLHWNCSVLIGAMSYSGEELLNHKEELLSLMQTLCRSCKTERGYSFAARLVQRVLMTLTSIYPRDQCFVNKDEWESEEFLKRSHLHWGKLYLAKDVKIDWHVPSDAEIDFVLTVLDQVVTPTLDEVERLQGDGLTRDKVWSNDFCRNLTVAKFAISSIPNLVTESEKSGAIEVMDAGDEVPEFIKPPPAFKSGFILTDPADPRYQKVSAFRKRFGELMRRAAANTQESGAEDQIDCVKLLVRSIKSYMTSYSYEPNDYRAHSRSLTFYRTITKMWAKQKAFPRVLWIRRAALYHTSRARLNSFQRSRSELDDQLIMHLLEFALSNYVGIRKAAQSTLDTVSSYYDGTRILCLPKLLEAIRPGVPDDRMKGALYVLGSKGWSNLALVDARFTAPYVLGLLGAQHHSKPSIQKLVRGVMNDFIIRVAEPSTLKSRVDSPDLIEAAQSLEKALPEALHSPQSELLGRVSVKCQTRVDRINATHAELSPQILEIARASTTHWSFSIFAARLLRALLRKDQPLPDEISRYLITEVVSENPKMRQYAQAAVTKMLTFLKLRTLCDSDEALLLGQSKNPLKRTETLPQPLPADWTRKHLASFSEAVTPQTKLRDKSSTGWLVWGREVEYYAVPPETEEPIVWDPSSKAAIDAVRQVISDMGWWESFFRHLSQEKDRDYISAESVSLVKSTFQVFGPGLLPYIKDSVESYIGQRDRHKHRAAAEVLSGVYRGSKHWPRKTQDDLWTWIDSLLPRIFSEATPDSQPSWDMAVEFMLHQRDPRRAMPLIEYVVKMAKETIGKDTASQSPWQQAKSQKLVRGAIVALNWKFAPWSSDFSELYFDRFGHDYLEVRTVLSESLADLDLQQVHPSFGSVDELLVACASGSGSLLARPQLYAGRFETLSRDLTAARKERIPTAQGSSMYDRASMTALLWISTTLGDHRNSAMAGEVIGFLPDIFSILELHDDLELSATARAVLDRIAAYPFPADLVPALVTQILQIIRKSTESWKARLDALPVLQVVYYLNLFNLNPEVVAEIIELLFGLLRDPHLEVREMAATTLSGIVRCSQRRLITALKRQFTETVQSVRLPRRGAPGFQEKLITLHSGILGAAALINAFPYEVPEWMPTLICETVAQHTDDPVPISTTTKKCAADFRRTHADTWNEDQHKFDPDQLTETNDWTLGRTDYFA